MSVMGGVVRSEGVSGTFDWTKMCLAFTADTPQVEVDLLRLTSV